jgi:drug/metabolite transporter (DMT)-like permease
MCLARRFRRRGRKETNRGAAPAHDPRQCALVQSLQCAGCDCFEQCQSIGSSVELTLFEILLDPSHDIGDGSEAEHPHSGGAREGIERGGFHFDREHAFRSGRLNSLCGFSERGIRGPARSDNARNIFVLQRLTGHFNEHRIGLGIVRSGRVVIARSLIAQRAVDDDEIWRPSCPGDLTRGCEAHQESAAAGKQLFRDQDGKGGTHGATHDADGLPGEREFVELAVITGPSFEWMRVARTPQPANNVAVGIENAHPRYFDERQAFLPARLAQKRRRPKDRRRNRFLVVENRRHGTIYVPKLPDGHVPRTCRSETPCAITASHLFEKSRDLGVSETGSTNWSASVEPARREHVPLAIVYMIAATIMFAASSAASKWLVESYPVGEVLFTRTVVALVACAVFIMPRTGFSVFRTRRLGHHVMRGVSQFFSQIFLLIAFSLMPLAGAIAINFSSPLFATLVSALLLKEAVGVARWTALLVGFCGVLIVANPGADTLQIGALFALGNAVLYGSVTAGVRSMTATESAETLTLYQLTLLTGLFALVLPWGWVSPTALDAAWIVFNGASNAIGQFWWTRALHLAPASAVAPFYYLSLIWASILGFAVWGEVPTIGLVIGSVVVVASGLFLLWRASNARQTLAEAAHD